MENKKKIKNQIAVAVFVKTPGTSPLKTRLAKTIGKELAEEIFIHSVRAIEEVLLSQEKYLDAYWALAEEESVHHPLWKNLSTLFVGRADLGTLLSRTYNTLREQYKYVFLLGADSPQINPNHIQKVLKKLQEGEFVFGPTHDGGFFLFAGSEKIGLDLWQSIVYSQNDTLKQLSKKLEKIAPVTYIDTLSDIDEENDLKIVISEFISPQIKQQEFINFIKRKF